LVAQPARVIGALQDQPLLVEPDRPAAGTEHQLAKQLAKRWMAAAVEQGVLVLVDLHVSAPRSLPIDQIINRS